MLTGTFSQKVSDSNSMAEFEAAKLKAEQNIAKAVIQDAAASAKNRVDEDEVKHKDGSKFADSEKATIKANIDKAAADGVGKISTDKTAGEANSICDDAVNIDGKSLRLVHDAYNWDYLTNRFYN
ncbi:hypothetical protein EQ500_05370 [Lactobacillus sp. XV13L]|nr:hypothetical protein [Lactobacillus sp. XV13L]